MKNSMVSYTRETLPSMDAEERQQLRKLDDQVDTSEIPVVTPEQTKGAVRGWGNHPGRARNRGKHAA